MFKLVDNKKYTKSKFILECDQGYVTECRPQFFITNPTCTFQLLPPHTPNFNPVSGKELEMEKTLFAPIIIPTVLFYHVLLSGEMEENNIKHFAELITVPMK
jgi:hypothetical protein